MNTKPYVWCDLDAVLAKYEGWKGLFTIGEPFAGAKQFIAKLIRLGEERGFKVGVFTCRTKLDMPGREILDEMFPQAGDAHLIEHLKGLVVQWLRMHKIPYHDVYAGQGKPMGVAYIDDKAVWCDPQTFGAEHAYAAAIEGVTNLTKKAG